MANSYHQVYIQTIFVVKYRNAIIIKDIRPHVLSVIGNLINETGCKSIIVNGVEDHVHCLIGLKPIVSISDLMQHVKAKSSKYLNDTNYMQQHFEWQDGYGVFSYGQSQLKTIYNYIAKQEEHHKTLSLKDEYQGFLKKFKVDYDERYIFKDLE